MTDGRDGQHETDADGLGSTKSEGAEQAVPRAASEPAGAFPSLAATAGSAAAPSSAAASLVAGAGSAGATGSNAAPSSAEPERPAGAAPGMAAAPAHAPANAPAVQAVRTGVVVGTLRRFFWMEERLRAAQQQAFGPGCPGWEEFELGRVAMLDADYLADPDQGRITALMLRRTAAGLVARAELARLGIDPGPTATLEDCWARLAEHPIGSSALARATEEERFRASSAMSAGGQRWLARLTPRERAGAMRALARVTRGVAAPMEADAQRVRAVRLTRWGRLVGFALVLLVGVLVVWAGVASLLAPQNLALHKPYTVVTPHPGVAVAPGALTDGKRANLGFHTNTGKGHYVTIDLGRVYRITRVVVYNRADCCPERAVPLSLELSTDGKTFRPAAQRPDPFERWQVTLAPTEARYVRLTNLSANYFHLAEVEVY